MRLRHLPPAGTPITASDLYAWMLGAFHPARSMELLQHELAERFGCRFVFVLSTGRAAMVVLLRALQAVSEAARYQVIVPAYTCYSVPSSIVKAGLQVRVVDIDPHTLDYDYDRLERCDLSRVLAIVSANLYGLPNDLQRLAGIATGAGAHLLDDAAQAMGARLNGRNCGTFGTAGIYSLDKGKVITTMNGGIIVTDDDRVAAAVARQVQHLDRPTTAHTAAEIGKLLAYSLLLDPSRYWLPARLPFLGLGETHYTVAYPVELYPAVMGGLARQLLRQLQRYNGARRANGFFYRQALYDVPGIRLITEQPGSDPIYLRFPLLVEDPLERERLLARLRAGGLGGSSSYPTAIVAIEALRGMISPFDEDAPGGRWLAERILTVPTHPYLNAEDRLSIARTIKRVRP